MSTGLYEQIKNTMRASDTRALAPSNSRSTSCVLLVVTTVRF